MKKDKLTYYQQMQHPLWQKKRLEVMEAYHFQCQDCGTTEQQLSVHHPYYKRGAMIWDYEAWELMCLCDKCHKIEHEVDEALKRQAAFLTVTQKTRVIGYVSAVGFDGKIKQFIDRFEYRTFRDTERTRNMITGVADAFRLKVGTVIKMISGGE